MNIEILHCYLSPGHNYVGRHGKAAEQHPIHEVDELLCVAGRGLRGDRYFGHSEDFKGQITFFADEVYQTLCAESGVSHQPPSVFRRNVITRGVDLNELVGVEFDIQGVRFAGVEQCKPCYWMDQAFAPGTEAAMRGRGGLRARILTDGILRTRALPGCSSTFAPFASSRDQQIGREGVSREGAKEAKIYGRVRDFEIGGSFR